MILLVGHLKGGVGKSTLVVNIAAELQRLGNDVILVEADPTVHTVTNWSRDREENGYRHIQTVQKTGNLRASLDELSGKYDYVIVDAPGKDSREMRTALTIANVFLMPFQPSQADLDTTESVVTTLNEAKDFNPELNAIAVMNRAATNVFTKDIREAKQYMESFPEITLAATIVHERKAYQNCLSEGLGVVEMKDSKAKAEIQLLTQEVIKW